MKPDMEAYMSLRIFFSVVGVGAGSGIIFVDGGEELRQGHLHRRIGGAKALRADPIAIAAIPAFTCL